MKHLYKSIVPLVMSGSEIELLPTSAALVPVMVSHPSTNCEPPEVRQRGHVGPCQPRALSTSCFHLLISSAALQSGPSVSMKENRPVVSLIQHLKVPPRSTGILHPSVAYPSLLPLPPRLHYSLPHLPSLRLLISSPSLSRCLSVSLSLTYTHTTHCSLCVSLPLVFVAPCMFHFFVSLL